MAKDAAWASFVDFMYEIGTTAPPELFLAPSSICVTAPSRIAQLPMPHADSRSDKANPKRLNSNIVAKAGLYRARRLCSAKPVRIGGVGECGITD